MPLVIVSPSATAVIVSKPSKPDLIVQTHWPLASAVCGFTEPPMLSFKTSESGLPTARSTLLPGAGSPYLSVTVTVTVQEEEESAKIE